jgi:hypothetical protein
MEKILTDEKDFHEAVVELNDQKKQFRKAFLGNAGIVVGVFLAFVAAVTTLTDIRITSFGDIASLGIKYFVLLFVSYQMYVNTSDSGVRRGLLTDEYLESQERYKKLKGEILKAGLQNKLPKYCADYIKRELENTRTVIVATIGYSYEDFVPYLSRDYKDIKKDPKLSRVQKRIIIKAAQVMPIRLTPEMIMQLGHGGKRSPLGINPVKKRNIARGIKFVTTAFTTLFVASLAFEVILKPTLENVMYTLACIVPIVLNGFTGYKMGYENIIFDTVEYTEAQSLVIQDFLQEEGYGHQGECSDEEGV